jgi:hypothetical protein
MKKISLLITILLFAQSCTTQLGRFTSISTDNVRGLEHVGKSRDEIAQSEGEKCLHTFYLTRTALGALFFFPWFMPSFDLKIGQTNDRISEAVRNAIKEGKSKGVFDGDMLINASIKEKSWFIPLIYGQKCIVAEGEVVSSVTRKKKS